MKVKITLLLLTLSLLSCQGQKTNSIQSPSTPYLVDPCEGCEAALEYSKDRILPSIDTLPGFELDGQKIRLSGTVFQEDGKTPVPNVILYLYHTNQEGIYENKFNATNMEKRHGYIRSWLKTDHQGQYAFWTLLPGVYPNHAEPAHVHLTVLEPDGKYYWLDSYHFLGDSILTQTVIEQMGNRGGSGIIELDKSTSVWSGHRDIILGKNIPGYTP